MSDTKSCTVCLQSKPLKEFYFANKKKTVYAARCKTCANKYSNTRNKTDQNRWLVILKYKFKCDKEEVRNMLVRQDGKCAICGKTSKKRRLHLDHDHQTGQIREFLCNDCNHGIGCFRDDTDLMLNAIEYIKKHKEVK